MKKPTVLVVDDSKPILVLLKAVLGRNYDVFAANDGFGAMDWLMRGNKPDIVISDLNMPNIDGVELISYLSNSSYYCNIPVLVLSGADENDILKKQIGFHVAGFIAKPFDPSVLLEKVANAIFRKEHSKNGSFQIS